MLETNESTCVLYTLHIILLSYACRISSIQLQGRLLFRKNWYYSPPKIRLANGKVIILSHFRWKFHFYSYLCIIFLFSKCSEISTEIAHLFRYFEANSSYSLWNANGWADFLCNINWWYFPFDDESGIGKKNARFYLRICDREKQLNNSNRGRIGHTNRSVQVLGGCCAQVNETKFMFYVGTGEDMWEDLWRT